MPVSCGFCNLRVLGLGVKLEVLESLKGRLIGSGPQNSVGTLTMGLRRRLNLKDLDSVHCGGDLRHHRFP